MAWPEGILNSVRKKEVIVGLTPRGKEKVDKFDGAGPKFLILAYLQENGASSLSQIGRRLNKDTDTVRIMVRQLISEESVRRVDGEGRVG